MSIQAVLQELQKPDSYLFRNCKQKLIEEGIKENDPLITTLDIFISQTFSTFSLKQLKLDRKYIKKLKIVSILSSFYGKQTISLSQLEQQLACSREECLNLLVQASIKIDEASNKIVIEKCKIRERQVKEEIDKYLKGKFKLIAEKNASLEHSLKDILKEIGGTPDQQEEIDKFDISSLRKRRQHEGHRH